MFFFVPGAGAVAEKEVSRGRLLVKLCVWEGWFLTLWVCTALFLKEGLSISGHKLWTTLV